MILQVSLVIHKCYIAQEPCSQQNCEWDYINLKGNGFWAGIHNEQLTFVLTVSWIHGMILLLLCTFTYCFSQKVAIILIIKHLKERNLYQANTWDKQLTAVIYSNPKWWDMQQKVQFYHNENLIGKLASVGSMVRF